MGVHDGHRGRLRGKFLENGLSGFDDITTLELVLFYSVPRQDTNPIAHRLLDRFGSLSGVLNASQEELYDAGLSDSTVALLKLMPEVVKKSAQKEKRSVKRITSPELASEYLIPKFMFDRDEKALLLCLDSNKKIIRCDEIARGVVNTVDLNVRLIAEKALQSKASSVILSHNHPDGSLTPSADDISTTQQLSKSLSLIGIQLDDHLIISGDSFTSLRALGYMG